VFTTSLDILAAYLIAANVRRWGWLLALYAGGAIALTIALGQAHVDLVPAHVAIPAAPLWTHAIFCMLCRWFFRALGEACPPVLGRGFSSPSTLARR
jgi:hypothetical protein